MLTPMRLYPKAHHNRVHGNEPSIQGARISFLKAAGLNFLLLQLLFLGLFAYIFGALFQQAGHTHNINVLFVDYDGGVIGSAIRKAYSTLKADSFPTIIERSPAQFLSPAYLREEVCSTRHWAALYVLPDASSRLEAALSSPTSSNSPATQYNRSNVIIFIWNEARYSTVVDIAIQENLQTLSSIARLAYVANNGTGAMELLSNGGADNLNIFANPWVLTSDNIQATTQGSRLIYNTLVIILILIQEFFYLGTINALYMQFKIYNRLYPHRIIAYRFIIALAYTFVGSLCVTGMIWAFRAGWDVNSNQFALTWAILWLFAHANFLCLDVFTIWLPPSYTPMALISWIIFNVTSILLPFELTPAFYRWAYAMPAHEVYQVLTDIWSRGCNPQLHYALPILFFLELLGLFFSALGVYRRCHYAVFQEEAQEQAFKARVDAAMAFERKHDVERDQEREQEKKYEPEGIRPDVDSEERAEEREREEMVNNIRNEDEEEVRLRKTKTGKSCNFGPSFDLAFKDD